MNDHWDVVVIGAGPAGSCAAWTAARAGMKTLLLERTPFPREKVCGCCLNPASLDAIAHMGLAHSLDTLGAVPLHALELSRGTTLARLRIPQGAAISRSVLDTLLANAATTQGATLMTPAHARVAERDARGNRTVLIRSPESQTTVTATTVVVADGLAGGSLADIAGAEVIERPESSIGVGARIHHALERGVIRMHLCSGGYLGLVALPDGTTDAAGCVNPDILRRAGGPAPWARSACESAGADPALINAISAARWTGTPRLTRRRAHIELPGILVAGDSAGYVEPFTGEGISWAMHAGLHAGTVAARACRGQFRTGEWHEWWHREIQPRRTACAIVRSTLRRPLLAGGIIALASAWPALGELLTARFGTRWRSQEAA
jgi:flavin-dependent dehydrogenase